MGFLLTGLSWMAGLLGLTLQTLCLACGLYYIAEFVEEYSVWAKKAITRILWAVMALHVLLLVTEHETMPVWQTLFSLGCHVIYSGLLWSFPVIQLQDPLFILSCVLVLVDHFLWFSYFTTYHTFRFVEILSVFGILVWLVPFMFFISLSASDYTLPTQDPLSPPAGKTGRAKLGNFLKGFLQYLLQKKEEWLPHKSSAGKSF